MPQIKLAPIGVTPGKDPDLTKGLDADPTRAIPKDAKGTPNRFTLNVPTDHTSLSLGEKASTWIDDPGISGRTDGHVHWHVVGTGRGTTPTLLTLGNAPTDPEIPSYDGSALKEARGYAMFTEGNAWHEAKGQSYFVSRTDSIVVRTVGPGKTAFVQSKTGTVDVQGGEKVSVTSQNHVAIGAGTGLVSDEPGYNKALKMLGITGLSARTAELATKTGELLQTALDLFKKFGPSSAPNVGSTGWKSDKKFLDYVFGAVGAHGLYGEAKNLFKKDTKNCVAITAQEGIGLMAGSSVTIFGGKSATLSGAWAADVSGLKSATVKSTGTASVSATKTSMSGILGVAVDALFGGVSAKARKEAALYSTHATVTVTSKKDAQLNSTDEKAFVHGKKGTFVGAGESAGYGTLTAPKGIVMGKVNSDSGKFARPKFNKKNVVAVKDDLITLTVGSSQIKITPKVILVKSPKVAAMKIDDGGKVNVKGSKILIG